MHSVGFFEAKYMKQSCISLPISGCSTAWKSRAGRRKLGESRALSIPKYSGLCKLLSPPQDCKIPQMAPHFFIPEGAGSGICKDSVLGGTGQAMAAERTFCPQVDWLFIIKSCSSQVFSHHFRTDVLSLCLVLLSTFLAWVDFLCLNLPTGNGETNSHLDTVQRMARKGLFSARMHC